MVSDIIKSIAIVGAGSFVGGAARYLVSLMMKGVGKGFPWATLAVNLVGCFLTVGLCGIHFIISSVKIEFLNNQSLPPSTVGRDYFAE